MFYARIKDFSKQEIMMLLCNCPKTPLSFCSSLSAVDNSTGSRQDKVGFDREQVQMVAVSPRCCMETNKSAEIGSSATARPC